MAAVLGAVFCIVDDLAFIAYDLWNLPGWQSSQYFAPYIVVKCLHGLACLLSFLPLVNSTLAVPRVHFPFNFVLALFVLGTLHVEAGLLAAYEDGFASPNHLFRVVVYYLGICSMLELWVVNTM